MCGSQIGTLSPSLTVMTGNLEERRCLPDSLRWVIREFRISALITTHRDTGAHKPGTHPLCLIFAIIRVSCLEKEREERQKKEREREGREGWRAGVGAAAAETGRRCYAPLPGINTSPWVPAHSDAPRVSGASGFLWALFFFFFRRGHVFILVHQGSVKIKWRLSMRDLR